MDTLLTMIFIIGLHLFLLQEIFLRVVSIRKESPYTPIFLSSKFVLLFSFGLSLISIFVYKKQQLVKIKYNKTDLKKGMSKITIYVAILFIVLLLLQ